MKHLSIFFTLFSISLAFSQDFEEKLFVKEHDSLPYRILLPENYNPNKFYPLILFLHGAGERGKDNKKQLFHVGSLFTSIAFRKQHEVIAVFPQCPKSSYWASVEKRSFRKKEKRFKFYKNLKKYRTMDLLESLLEEIDALYKIDVSRRYIGGLSMGGMGTFELTTRMSTYFAAAFAICGGGNPKWAKKLSKTPFWIFHGELDNVVSYTHSKRMYKEMKLYNDETRLTLYKGVNHASWVPAFAEPELLNWLLSFQKSTKD